MTLNTDTHTDTHTDTQTPSQTLKRIKKASLALGLLISSSLLTACGADLNQLLNLTHAVEDVLTSAQENQATGNSDSPTSAGARPRLAAGKGAGSGFRQAKSVDSHQAAFAEAGGQQLSAVAEADWGEAAYNLPADCLVRAGGGEMVQSAAPASAFELSHARSHSQGATGCVRASKGASPASGGQAFYTPARPLPGMAHANGGPVLTHACAGVTMANAVTLPVNTEADTATPGPHLQATTFATGFGAAPCQLIQLPEGSDAAHHSSADAGPVHLRYRHCGGQTMAMPAPAAVRLRRGSPTAGVTASAAGHAYLAGCGDVASGQAGSVTIVHAEAADSQE